MSTNVSTGSFTVKMLDKTIDVALTSAASKQLKKCTQPLCVEMELYFSCLIRKQVRIRKQLDSEFIVKVNDWLTLGFRPVMTKTCSVHDYEDAPPPLSDFPICKPQSYIPHWLKLDYHKGKWKGDFGY